MLFGQFVKNKL